MKNYIEVTQLICSPKEMSDYETKFSLYQKAKNEYREDVGVDVGYHEFNEPFPKMHEAKISFCPEDILHMSETFSPKEVGDDLKTISGTSIVLRDGSFIECIEDYKTVKVKIKAYYKKIDA